MKLPEYLSAKRAKERQSTLNKVCPKSRTDDQSVLFSKEAESLLLKEHLAGNDEAQESVAKKTM